MNLQHCSPENPGWPARTQRAISSLLLFEMPANAGVATGNCLKARVQIYEASLCEAKFQNHYIAGDTISLTGSWDLSCQSTTVGGF